MRYAFEPPPVSSVVVSGGGNFPVRRIFCIGKNYADHVREMGGDPKSTPPVFFTKPADAIVPCGAVIPYPQSTSNFHFEGELVIVLKDGGRNIPTHGAAQALVFGYACGCDLTRRDLQLAAKNAGAPWDVAKGFDNSAAIGPITRAEAANLDGVRLKLSVNGELRQDEALSSMIWDVPEIIMALSRYFELKAGDLIYTGTPAGVGPLQIGDQVLVEIDPLAPLEFSIGPAA
jgi:fumarylpyruvate hydrolase